MVVVTALSFALCLFIDKGHFFSCLGSSATSFPDQSRVAPSSRERGIGCGTLASNVATKTFPVSVRLVGRSAVFALGEAGALPWEDELEKKD